MTSPISAIEMYLKKPWEAIHKELKKTEAHETYVENLAENILDFSLDFITSSAKEVHVTSKKGLLINSISMYNNNIRWASVTSMPKTLTEMTEAYKEVYKTMQAKHWCEHVKYVFAVLEQTAMQTFATLSIGVNCTITETTDKQVKVVSKFKHNKFGEFEVFGLSKDIYVAFTHMMGRLYEKFLIAMRKDFNGFNHAVDNFVSLDLMINNTPYDVHMDLSKENFELLTSTDKIVAVKGTLRILDTSIDVHISYDPNSDETYEELTSRFNEYATTVSVGYKAKKAKREYKTLAKTN